MSVALVLGGGAPNLTLMTGALLALDEAGVDFQVITTTGAGMVVGLLYAAPRREHPDETWPEARRRALRATREMGIDDLIYDQFPVNYKIFQKPGKLAEAYAHTVNPAIWSIPRETRRQRLLGDTMGFFAAMMQPVSLSAASKGLCQPPPWIELMVDFDDLQKNLAEGNKKFRLTAFCIEDEKEETFNKHEITAEHFKAALAMPFIYSPYKMKDESGRVKTYLEASAFQTMELNPDDVMEEGNVKTLIYFDLMGNRKLVGEPRHLVDAWGKSIVAPLTQIAQQQLAVTELKRGAEMLLEHFAEEVTEYIELLWGIKETIAQSKGVMKNKEQKEVLDKIDKMIDGSRHDMEENNMRLRNILRTFDRNSPMVAQEEGIPSEGRSERAAHDADERMKRTGHQKQGKADKKTDLLGHLVAMSILHDAIIGSHGQKLADLTMLRMPFRDHIPQDYWPKVLDWSHSNMSTLFDIGYKTGKAFLEDNWEALGLERSPSRV